MTDITMQLGDGTALEGFLEGEASLGTVVFTHGSGSGRHSPRNRQVAEVLQARGFRTLLIDLLTPEEEQVDLITREHRFDIDLLGERVVGVIDWLGDASPIGVFGASTGAAAALRAAAERPDRVHAVVSRGGRPDLAGDSLGSVTAPTLLIVGGRDLTVLDLNREARARMPGLVELVVIPGATHLFEEPGAIDAVAELAADWFHTQLASAGANR